jgi:superfamily I DNA and/or RNA helicase/very-short-patch-repair endonuclease
MLALIDPESQERLREDDWSSEGGVIKSEDSIYMPLRLNQKQTLALKKADTQIATVIQGPPGTGKTRTIAAMVTHFLAKGERVLVTAQTGQALKEVRDKLPDEIRALAVSNLSGKKSDNDAVQASVNALIDADEKRNEYIDEYPANEKRILKKIDDFKKSKSKLNRAILDVRGKETQEITIAGFKNTPASLLTYFIHNRKSIEWLESLLSTGELPKISPDNFETLINLQREINGKTFSLETEVVLLKMEELWGNEDIRNYFSLKSSIDNNFSQVKIRNLESRELKEAYDEANLLQSQMKALDLSQSPEIGKAIFAGSGTFPSDYISDLLSTIKVFESLFNDLGDIEEISAHQTDESWIPLLANLREEIGKNGKLKLKPSGEIKIPLFGSQILKVNRAILDSVKISGLSIRTTNDVDRVTALVKFDSLINKEWASHTVGIESYDRKGLKKRVLLQKSILTIAIKYQKSISDVRKICEKLNLVSIVSANGDIDLEILGRFMATQELVLKEAEIKSSYEKLIEVIEKLNNDFPDIFSEYLDSLRKGSILSDEILNKVRNFFSLQLKFSEFKQLTSQAAADHPKLLDWLDSFLRTSASSDLDKLLELQQSLNLARLGRGLMQNNNESYSDYFAKISFCDEQIEILVQDLARRRAWMKALQRISQTTLSDMKRYAHANKGLGKGTGKSAARRKQDIRALLKNCSGAVPVWIMPIERIAEQFAPMVNLFDVVIVDEASQAGLDALFLLGITKRIVIVGDDKQVSPDSIGIKSDSVLEIHSNNFSPNQRLNWRNPDVSLFDECKMAFGNMVTLTEHRRCVPDIIEFSNLIAYMPEKIRLVPLRQTGSASFAPIITHFVSDGYLSGSGTSITNPPEATAIANKVAELVADPKYADMTIGVISLQGTKQHELIQQKINDLISQEEIDKHKIRVDRPPAFQGAERNVILLSMLMVPGKGTAQTKNTQIQRYNVAMSRAQDQVILFHSMRESDLSNNEDLRKRLLTYCLEVEKKSLIPLEATEQVPNDTRVEPFDSLFEQRVYNKIVARGYMVVPQYSPMLEGHDYRIDLVVIGPFGKLAIECDGEFWHGEDEYQQDLDRQNELFDAGWQIFRIRESDFYGDENSLDSLWEILENLISLASNQSPAIKKPKIDEKEVLAFGVANIKHESFTEDSIKIATENISSTQPEQIKEEVAASTNTWVLTPGRVLHDPAQKSGFASDLLEIIITDSPIKVSELILKHKNAIDNPEIKDSVYKQALLQLNRDNQIQILNDAAQLFDQTVIARD